ncbi:tetratricopeptide repeat protein [Frankia sp. AgKG'84/4]|uniref:tetratricopeptide repeat protein n=1 Tax=Frankia sp. AgKG'84/4 TaxID=573490 RepID=UPI00202A5276|nr:tetratricopeptide repeat protein [Frankia sp. AgKG'84/4]MCL9793562.1 tetratricopeptide repeat protein [Frankia sp. AgKG'84/4]
MSCAEDGLGWAEWIAATLEDAGLRVRLGAWDVVPGTHRPSWLDGVTRQARHMVAVVSDGYLDSAAARAEWGAAWSPRILDGERRLVVARVTDRPVPGLLGQLVPIDLVGRSPLAAQTMLLAAVRGEGARGETSSGRMPDRPGSAGGALFPGELPAVWNVPRPAARFVGRTAALGHLDDAMSAGRLVAVTGLAGIGKTSLAVEYVRQQRMGFDAVWWVPAGRPELVGDRVRALAPALGLPDHAEPAAVLARLDAADGRWLLVLDDAAGPGELPGWLRPSSSQGRILVTSRTDDWDGAGEVVPVGPFTRAESVALLSERLPAVDPAVAGRIAERLGDHPLALDQAAHRIAQARAPAETYLTALLDRPAVVLGQGAVPGRPGITAATLWDEPIRRLDADTPAAGELLRLAAHGDGTPLPLRLLAADPEAIHDKALRTAAGDPLELAGTVATLERAGLAHRDGAAVTMHPLVRAAVRANTGPDQATEHVDILARMLRTALPERITATPDAWPAWREHLPHTLAVLEATDPAADSPRTAWLAEHAAAYLTEQGHPEQAEPLAARAVAARERLDGTDHPDTLTARETHIRAALNADHPAIAGPLAERNAVDRARILGPDHPDTLTSRETLARAYQHTGHHDHAQTLFRQNLTDRERTLGPDHPATLESRHDLGVAHADAGHSDRAADVLRTTLNDRHRLLGPDHPDTLDTHHHLATTYQRIGAANDALAHAEPTLAARERVLGPDHPRTLDSRHQLGVTYHQAGRLDDAAHELDQALAVREQVLGSTHPRTLDSAQALARTHLRAGRPEAAVPLLNRALFGREHVHGPDHSLTTESRESLAAAHLAEGRPSEATPHLERALDRHERVLGRTHAHAVEARDDLAAHYRDAGQPEAARHHLERQLVARARTDGVADERTLRTATSLADVCRQTGRLPQAVDLNERVHATRTHTLGPEHPDTRASRTTLADTYCQAGRHSDAAPLYRDALTDAMRDHGSYHPDTIRARRALADTTYRSDAVAPPERMPATERQPAPARPPSPDAKDLRVGP